MANSIGLPQACVPVAGQVTSDHLTFGEKGEDKGDGDGCGQNTNQKLPLVTGVIW